MIRNCVICNKTLYEEDAILAVIDKGWDTENGVETDLRLGCITGCVPKGTCKSCRPKEPCPNCLTPTEVSFMAKVNLSTGLRENLCYRCSNCEHGWTVNRKDSRI